MTTGPSLGIFWVYHRRILAFKVPMDSVSAVGKMRDADYAHADSWADVVKKHRELASKEYWAIPRGRVIFRATEEMFVIFASTSIVTDPGLISKIFQSFRLPSHDRVRVMTDRHYDPAGDDLFED